MEGAIRASRQVRIVNAHGLHMRPASKFVSLAVKFQAQISVGCRGVQANGKSILDMASLAAECGSMLDLAAEGCDAEPALSALAELVEAGFEMTDEDYP